jgi:hypothetical protein
MRNILEALTVIAGITAALGALVAAWYAIGWMVGLLLRRFPLARTPSQLKQF